MQMEQEVTASIAAPIEAARFAVSVFPTMGATEVDAREMTLAGLASMVQEARAHEKAALPWLKLARFGDKKSSSGSLRSEANMLALSGLVADYDGEQVGPKEAAFFLEKHGIAGLIYTSPSHRDLKPRWRVVCPFSVEQPLTAHTPLMDRLNGVLGGILAPESWVVAQCYFFGRVDDGAPVRVEVVEGDPVDTLYHLDAIAMSKATHTAPIGSALGGVNVAAAVAPQTTGGSLGIAGVIDDGREAYMRSLVMAHFCEFCAEYGSVPSPQELFDTVWPVYAAHVDLSKAGRGADEVAEKCAYIIRRFEAGELRSNGKALPDLETVIAVHNARQDKSGRFKGEAPPTVVSPKKADTGIQFTSFTTLLTEDVVEEPDYIEPDFMGPGGFVLIAGPPKAQKSFFLQEVLVAAATGGGFLNHYSAARPLRVFYLQAEMNRKLLRRRARAMTFLTEAQKQCLATNLFVSERFYMILDERGVELAVETIRQAFPDAPPDVIAIDPLANLFSGDNENDNTQLMGFLTQRVEAVRRAINPMAAIVMVHHATKKSVEDLERDPFIAIRGAGALRGYYDTGVIMFRKSEAGPERRIFVENRNGEAPEPMTAVLHNGRFMLTEESEGVSMTAAQAIWSDMRKRWNDGQGVSLQPQTRRTGRFAPVIYSKMFGMPPREVARLIESWLANGICVVEPISKHQKQMGIKPVQHIGTTI